MIKGGSGAGSSAAGGSGKDNVDSDIESCSDSCSSSGSSGNGDGSSGRTSRDDEPLSFSYGMRLVTALKTCAGQLHGGYKLTRKCVDLQDKEAKCTKTQRATDATGVRQGSLTRLKHWALMANDAVPKAFRDKLWSNAVMVAWSVGIMPSIEELESAMATPASSGASSSGAGVSSAVHAAIVRAPPRAALMQHHLRRKGGQSNDLFIG